MVASAKMETANVPKDLQGIIVNLEMVGTLALSTLIAPQLVQIKACSAQIEAWRITMEMWTPQ